MRVTRAPRRTAQEGDAATAAAAPVTKGCMGCIAKNIRGLGLLRARRGQTHLGHEEIAAVAEVVRLMGAVEKRQVTRLTGVENFGFGAEGVGKQRLLLLLMLQLLRHILWDCGVQADVALPPAARHARASQRARAAVPLHVLQSLAERFGKPGYPGAARPLNVASAEHGFVPASSFLSSRA